MAKVPVGKGGRGAGGALPEETRAILGATTNAGKAARSGLGGLLANAGDEARGFWQALQTPMGAANLATGFLGRFAVPAQVALEASRDPKALEESPETAIPMAFLRSQTPISLFEQSPGWNQFAQGARQQVTETLAAPGNLLKPGGVGRISTRSAENLVKMLQGIRQGFYDAPVASTLGFAAPVLHMASAHAPAAGVADEAGMVAHHGTPHTFSPTAKNPLGEFDLSKMGSGEGAQAYGWGTYLAENPRIAKHYQRVLSTGYKGPSGEHVDYSTFRKHLEDVVRPHVEKQAQEFYDWQRSKGGEIYMRVDVGSQTNQIVNNLIDWTDTRQSNYLDHRTPPYEYRDAYTAGANEAHKFKKSGGSFYSVDVPDEHVANFLDWDAVGTRQPVIVKKAYDELFGQFAHAGELDGKTMYRDISRKLGSEEAASRYLASKGVFGLKFLDRISRTAKIRMSRDPSQGTRNLVIFDPSITTITARK